MAYTIEIHYQTGDSFGSHDETEEVGCVWEDKAQAQLALSYIKEHYELYKQMSGWDPKVKEKDIHKIVKTKPWADEKIEYWKYSMRLPVGDKTQDVSIFWCGYFETLHGAKIISVGDDADSFEF